ncbi:transposase, partial [Burkholderia cepacia]|nr:transposase [Burkholderia cepacia]
ELKKKYHKATKKKKGQLLDDFCEFTGYHRKVALRLVNNRLPGKWKRYKKRKKQYDQPVIDALLTLWRAVDEICGERLHPFIPELLDKMIECGELEGDEVAKAKLLKISMGTVKKILGKTKRRSLIKIGGTTKPGSLLKSQIAIRYGPWEEVDPG